MAKQVRVRRDTLTNLNLVIPADGELAYNLTDDRMHVGDGSTSGGIPHANFRDIIYDKFIYANDSGTANAYAVDLLYDPPSWTAGMRLKFKAANTNTGASTIAVTGLAGTKNIFKYTGTTLGNLAANDIVAGGIYEIAYDGTQWQLQTYANAGITTVRQGDLATSTGSVSKTDSPLGQALFTLPGGEYGFYPQIRAASLGGTISVSQADGFAGSTIGTTFLTRISMGFVTSGSGNTVYAQQRYITSSPPFEDERYGGPAQGFFFALVNSSGDIISHYAADVPPWAYNGPTKIRADHICPITRKKFRRVIKERSFEEIMDGASIEYEMQEITQAIKNADMDLIPHPFGEVPEGCQVILLDPTDDRIGRLIDYQNVYGSEEIMEQIQKGFIQINNDKPARRSAKGAENGFAIHRMKYKYSGRLKNE